MVKRSGRGIGGRRLLGLAFALAAIPALAHDMPGMGRGATTARASPSDRAFAASMEDMMKGMAVKPTGDPDRDFAAMMVPHHEGAIAMARAELRFGKDPVLRKLAADIVAAQEGEIAILRAWEGRRAR